MSKNPKLPIQVAFMFIKDYGLSHLSEFEKVKLKSSQKTNKVIIKMKGDKKLNPEFWSDIVNRVADLGFRWEDDLKIRIKINNYGKSAVLTLKLK